MNLAARRRTRRGFTLLELIVVLIVLGLLAAIAIPTFSHVIGRAGDRAVEVTAESLGRNLQSLAALDRGNPRSLDPEVATSEVSGGYGFDTSGYASAGTIVVTRDSHCAVLTMPESYSAQPTVTPCGTDAAPPIVDLSGVARAFLTALAVEADGTGLIPDPTGLYPAGATWTVITSGTDEMDADHAAPGEIRVGWYDDTDDLIELSFQGGEQGCVATWIAAYQSPWLLVTMDYAPVTPGVCNGAADEDSPPTIETYEEWSPSLGHWTGVPCPWC